MADTAAVLWVRDFLFFRELVTPGVLFAAYYTGALLIPVVVFDLARRFRRRVQARLTAEGVLPGRLRAPVAWAAGYAVVAFLLAELAWRMMFEFMLAYFQMHAAITGLGG
ncbi:hypothetical protein TVNIR_1537 [Thioalkalivibrio nitratireducens DSM 14787]|uniref:DUF4282 domain-containing protein n=1 Tax=Thioalkalivibrio nitratireducens (strain DSM 14787 / UNIQEM 213 / ALEN2) TaxID=1255043 RepID=L0DUC9_THIND|nr:DUF4282 domain-containing protein [Thioalkalivibrio nitratireducens]AGA33204.1 hypothetical protein TVNIR_1537 [Thioalkalivibrio nitratireducens DSM 14787]